VVAGGVAGRGPEPAGPVVEAQEARGVRPGSRNQQTNIDVRGDYYAAALPVH
jgi:hypothetical protein